MQSGYGVSEIPQFMVESCGSSLFSISPVNPSAAAPAVAPSDVKYHHPLHQPHPHYPHHQQQHQHQHQHQQQQQQQHPHHHHQHLAPPQPAPLPPHFSHFHHGIPITQQLFQQPHHQLQLFHHHQLSHPLPPQLEPRRLIPPHQLGLDQESAPENSASPTRIIGGPGGGAVAADGGGGGGGGGPSFLASAMNFKLAVNESSGGGSREGINDDDGGILQGDEDGSESRLHHWQREDESAIKEPSWRPLDIDYINANSKRCKNKEPETSTSCKYTKKNKEVAESDDGHATGGSNYKLFSELEAIYKPGGGGGPNQTGSGSALTADETPIVHATAMAATTGLPADADNRVGGCSETSAGEEATAKKFAKSSARRRRKRRHQQHQQQLNSVAVFLENLVKQLMDHQESLHRRFLEVMEKRDQERTNREEAWRKQEAAKSSREAAARAHERALASSREAAIVAFLEKITGETLNLPPKPQFSDVEAYKDPDNNDVANNNDLQIEPISSADGLNALDAGDTCNKVTLNTSRWPKAEVQALIRVRSGLETRFQEPGLKGPLWEEVSMTMAAMGYSRNAKRCKEKWENINKYFRKTKESGKKRPQHSKTCPYFQQLDQLYSKSLNSKQQVQQQQPAPLPASSSSPNTANLTSATGNKDQRNDVSSELLDAIVVSTDNRINLKFSDMSTVGYDFNGGKGGRHDANDDNDMEMAGNEEEEDDELDRGGEGYGDGGEEGEGESQEYQLHQDKEEEEEDEEDEEDLHDSALFFQRLQS